MERPRVSVVIPTRNEEGSIGGVLNDVQQALAGLGWSYEILVVDTDSKDRTVELARAGGATVVREARRGYGRAYKTGFERAQGELLVTLDADSTYPADRIPGLLRMVHSGTCDFAVGDRMTLLDPRVMTLGHRVGNHILNLALRILHGISLRDSQSGMWVFRKSVLEGLVLVSDGMAFSEELKLAVVKKGYRLIEVPIEYGTRIGEAKLSSWKDGWGNLKFLVSSRSSMSPRDTSFPAGWIRRRNH